MAETVVLDPSAVASNRTELDITSWVAAEPGIDWGDAAFEGYMAQAERGDIPVDGRLPNRIITIPLRLRTVGATSFSSIRLSIQQKAGLFQREGGWVMRQVGSTPLYADVVNATLRLSGSWLQANKSADVDATLTLECLPDWYGAEVDLGDNVETTLPELVFTDTGVAGNYPGRVRIVVDDDSATSQYGLLWGVRSRHYSADATAALAYEAEALTNLDSAADAVLTGSSGGSVVTHSNLSTGWTPVLSTQHATSGHLTHTGSYRVWARVYTTSTATVQVRLVWDVGDLVNPVENTAWEIPLASQFFVADLGEVRLDQAPVGTHRWVGAIQAKGSAGGQNVSIDRVWFQPLEVGGRLVASVNASEGLVAYSARDEFNYAAANLTGKTAPVGGVWAGAGDAADFAVDNVSNVEGPATRNVTADAANTGRFVTLGSALLTTQLVRVDALYFTDPGSDSLLLGVLGRYTDASNYVAAVIEPDEDQVRVFVRVAGVITTLGTHSLATSIDRWYTLRMAVFANGVVQVWCAPQAAGVGSPLIVAQHSSLATGGALDDGKVGFYDEYAGAVAINRWYDNFAAWVPATDAVIHASQSLELSTQGMFREDSTGAAYGPVSHVVGDLPRLPPAGLEARTVQVFLKGSRGDFGSLPDAGIDDVSARAYYRPSWLYVGE